MKAQLVLDALSIAHENGGVLISSKKGNGDIIWLDMHFEQSEQVDVFAQTCQVHNVGRIMELKGNNIISIML